MKIRKDDIVKVIAGKDKGKEGKIIQAFPKLAMVVVEGVNIRKKHLRAQKRGEKGQRIELPFPISVSNVMLIDKNINKPVRAGWKFEGEKKVRFSKKTGAII